ncbi:MAG: hypothetical protein Q4G01_06075 [Eubacteriales bacterium]|nr:hypothetical protein [Eubacteriales bacterium]
MGLRICQVRITPGFLFLAAFLFYQSTSSFLVTFLLAAALHEGGHLLAARWRGVPVRALSMTAFGCVLDFVDEALVRDRDLLWIAAAGPLCNLLFALLCVTPWVGRWRGAALFGAEHLLLALFNLLPVFPLDGAVLCAGLLKPNVGERRAEQVVLALSGGLGLAAVGAALWWGGDAGMRLLLLAGWVGATSCKRCLVIPAAFR